MSHNDIQIKNCVLWSAQLDEMCPTSDTTQGEQESQHRQVRKLLTTQPIPAYGFNRTSQ
ncbi:hypothetical protein J6590_050071 [Homalodisca vitripennis]|nr:hypothetical protein J6590_050071 [Homalodisca vitripennis]